MPRLRKHKVPCHRKLVLKRPNKKTEDGKLYDRLWELCKERRIDDYTYEGSGKWRITIGATPPSRMTTQEVLKTFG